MGHLDDVVRQSMMEKRVARGERTLRETREARRDRHQYIR